MSELTSYTLFKIDGQSKYFDPFDREFINIDVVDIDKFKLKGLQNLSYLFYTDQKFYSMKNNGRLGDGTLFTSTLDLSLFQSVSEIEVS